MKKILFLRGAVPTNRDPRQIMFDDIEESVIKSLRKYKDNF
jgi:hypothetical protein